MTINLEKWAEDAKMMIKDAGEFSKKGLWQNCVYEHMTDLVNNETIVKGSRYQKLFGGLRFAYEKATGKMVYQEVLA